MFGRKQAKKAVADTGDNGAEDVGAPPELIDELREPEPVNEATREQALRLAEGALEEGWRRFGCPRCGVKYDVLQPTQQTPGTWEVDFTCESCDLHVARLPVTG